MTKISLLLVLLSITSCTKNQGLLKLICMDAGREAIFKRDQPLERIDCGDYKPAGGNRPKFD